MITYKYISWKESVFFPFISTKPPTALIFTPFQAMPRNMMYNKYELHTFTLLCFQMSQFYLPNLLFKNTTSNFSKVHFLSMLCFVVEKKYRIWKVCFRIIMGYFQSKIQPNSKFLSKKKPSDNSNLLKYSRNIMINCKSEKTGMLNKYFCCILQRQGCMPQDWWNTSLYWVRNMLASSFWSLTF